MIRALAKEFTYPSLIPHVYTGVESLYPLLARMAAAAKETPSKRTPRRSTTTTTNYGHVSDTCTFSLVIVIFLLVYSRMKDVEVLPEQYNVWVDKAVRTVLGLPSSAKQCSGGCSKEEIMPVIEETMAMAQEEGWLQMQWFESVKPQEDGDENGNDYDDMEGVGMTGRVATSGQTKRLRSGGDGGSDYIGLGTMMQDATDYLGERQQQDYTMWKAKILARVQEMEIPA
ncbi:origin recognition complex subunit 6 [Pyrenophora seminiperda CCB06]|uniref:Origin recognition complex subunit 6 n=1 Tax=Pyrenophora seminiperda CCB06 TaxID=1302712 RepID=A0A3M7M3V4_9PLEO|nr:origin recognition complex subunit 6 [Pyrenophora seminiperda CCB06]